LQSPTPTDISTLSLHDALPILINPHLENPDAAYPAVVAAVVPAGLRGLVVAAVISAIMSTVSGLVNSTSTMVTLDLVQRSKGRRSEEHTSELQSRSDLVCRLLL